MLFPWTDKHGIVTQNLNKITINEKFFPHVGYNYYD